MRAVAITMLLDVDSDDEAFDAVNEILREHQRSFAPGSCLIDYAIGKAPVDAGPLPADYAEGDYFASPARSSFERAPENAGEMPIAARESSGKLNTDPFADMEARRASLDTPEKIAERLKFSESRALLKLANNADNWRTAFTLSVSSATLANLNDFDRADRGLLPPLILVSRQRGDPSGAYVYAISELGKKVASALISNQNKDA